MVPGDRTKIRAYLLRRLSDEERDAFEARLLEERDLLQAVEHVESELLGGDTVPRITLHKACAACFVAGAVAGALLVEGMHRLLS